MEDNGMKEMGFDFKKEETNTNNDNRAGSVDSNILNIGKGTADVEKDTIDVAEDVLNLFKKIFYFVAVVCGICGLVQCIVVGQISPMYGFGVMILYFLAAFLIGYMANIYVKWGRALIMLIVNISATLKRIEINQEKENLNS